MSTLPLRAPRPAWRFVGTSFLLNALGATVGIWLTFAIGWSMSDMLMRRWALPDEPSLRGIAVATLAFLLGGTLGGASWGGFQAAALRARLAAPKRWMAASAAGLGVGIAGALALSFPLAQAIWGSAWADESQPLLLLCLALAGALLGAAQATQLPSHRAWWVVACALGMVAMGAVGTLLAMPLAGLAFATLTTPVLVAMQRAP